MMTPATNRAYNPHVRPTPSSEAAIREQAQRKSARFQLSGHVTEHSARLVRQRILDEILEGQRSIVIDLGQALSFDSGSLGIKLAATIKATIDVKPRAKKNVIHLRSRHVRVAILSTATFDAVERIDPTSVTFGKTGAEESLLKCDKKGRQVNGDKLRDLVCTFRVAKTNLGASDVAGVLKAKTKAGAEVVGTDALTVVAKQKGEKDQDCDDDDDEWSDRDDD